MIAYFWVALGGALGSVGRYWLSGVVSATRPGEAFPWGTLLVNVSGSFLIGILAALMSADGRVGARPNARAFLVVGICGGYTTFSAFSLETLALMQKGQLLHAGGNVLLSVVLCLLAVWLGYLLGSAFNSLKTH